MNFKLLNIPVQIHPSFWIFLIFFTNLYQNISVESFILAGVIIFSLLVHEMGHALTALYFGAKPKITLEGFGGSAQYDPRGITSKQRFLITLNGPLLESLLIVLPYFLLKSGLFEANYYLLYFLTTTMYVNVMWCLLNLIPIAPLDGGYLLSYALERKFGEKGYKASLIIGLMFVSVLAPYLCFRGSLFFGILLIMFGWQSFQVFKSLSVSSRKPNQFSSYVEGVKAIEDQDLEKAKVILKKLLKSQDQKIKNSATESLAKVYFQENKPKKSYDLLLQADQNSLREGKYLLCKLAFEQGNYKLVEKYSREIYQIEPSYDVAILNSKAFARLNEATYAGAWMETASQFGPECKEKAKEVLEDEVYDSVRHLEAFKVYEEKIRGSNSFS